MVDIGSSIKKQILNVLKELLRLVFNNLKYIAQKKYPCFKTFLIPTDHYSILPYILKSLSHTILFLFDVCHINLNWKEVSANLDHVFGKKKSENTIH